SLKRQLQRKLNLPRRADVVQDLAGVAMAHGNSVCKRSVQVRRPIPNDRHSPIHVVKQVEELGPELKAHILPKLGVLRDSDIRVVESPTPQTQPSGVAEGAEWREREGRRIEIQLTRISGHWIAVAHEIGPWIY